MQVPINIMLLVQLLLSIFDLKKIISSIILIIHYQKKQNKKNKKNNSGGDDDGTLFVDVELNASSKGCILNPKKKATSTKTIMNGIHFIHAVKYLANHAMNHQIPHYTEIKLEGFICMALAIYNVIKVLMLMMSFFETKPLKIDPEGEEEYFDIEAGMTKLPCFFENKPLKIGPEGDDEWFDIEAGMTKLPVKSSGIPSTTTKCGLVKKLFESKWVKETMEMFHLLDSIDALSHAKHIILNFTKIKVESIFISIHFIESVHTVSHVVGLV